MGGIGIIRHIGDCRAIANQPIATFQPMFQFLHCLGRCGIGEFYVQGRAENGDQSCGTGPEGNFACRKCQPALNIGLIDRRAWHPVRRICPCEVDEDCVGIRYGYIPILQDRDLPVRVHGQKLRRFMFTTCQIYGNFLMCDPCELRKHQGAVSVT